MEQKESFFNRLFAKKSNSCCCGSFKIERKETEKAEGVKTTKASEVSQTKNTDKK